MDKSPVGMTARHVEREQRHGRALAQKLKVEQNGSQRRLMKVSRLKTAGLTLRLREATAEATSVALGGESGRSTRPAHPGTTAASQLLTPPSRTSFVTRFLVSQEPLSSSPDSTASILSFGLGPTSASGLRARLAGRREVDGLLQTPGRAPDGPEPDAEQPGADSWATLLASRSLSGRLRSFGLGRFDRGGRGAGSFAAEASSDDDGGWGGSMACDDPDRGSCATVLLR